MISKCQNVLIVAAASSKDGMGHLIRCRALAVELLERGVTVRFLRCGDNENQVGELLPFPSTSVDILDDGFGKEFKQECAGCDWVVIDNYSFKGNEWMLLSHENSARLIVIDDVPERTITADWVLNYNINHMRHYQGTGVRAQRFITGLNYALLPQDYSLACWGRACWSGSLQRIMVSFGGLDSLGCTNKVLELLVQRKDFLEKIDVVIGPHNTSFDTAITTIFGNKIAVHRGLKNLSTLMAQADIIITPSSTTALQACCVGVPILIVKTVSNQNLLFETLCETASVNGLDYKELIEGKLFIMLMNKLDNIDYRLYSANTAKELVDGKGVNRLVDLMCTI